MYLKSPPKCFYGGEGIKNDRLVTYKIQYIHEEIAIIILRGVGTGVAGVALATPRFLNLLNRNFENCLFLISVFSTGYP